MTRRNLDLYTTDTRITDLLLDRVGVGGTVLEPCAGPGRMAGALAAHGPVARVLTNDIDPQYGTCMVGDAVDGGADCWQVPGVDWVVTNPPFKQGHLILPHAYRVARVGVAFLLRLTYAEPANGRGQWLADQADQQVLQITLNPRPQFRAGEINRRTGKEYGTDFATVAWFVWLKGWSWRRRGIRCPFQYASSWDE